DVTMAILFRHTPGGNYNAASYVDLVQQNSSDRLDQVTNGSVSIHLAPGNLMGLQDFDEYFYTLNGIPIYKAARGGDFQYLSEATGGYYFDYSSGSATATF
ncbi:hypothetical protein AB4144_61290, partial [Rhizobiaceae sp. 2RAB30]